MTAINAINLKAAHDARFDMESPINDMIMGAETMEVVAITALEAEAGILDNSHWLWMAKRMGETARTVQDKWNQLHCALRGVGTVDAEGQKEVRDTPTMPPEIAEYVAACIAYDKAWEAHRGTDDKAAAEAHDQALERINKAEKIIEDKPTRTEWDAFGKWLFLTRMVMGGTTPRDEYWIKWTREWADALGAPECMEAIRSAGAGQ